MAAIIACFSRVHENYFDFSGKTILPFCTHEGSGMGRSDFEKPEKKYG